MVQDHSQKIHTKINIIIYLFKISEGEAYNELCLPLPSVRPWLQSERESLSWLCPECRKIELSFLESWGTIGRGWLVFRSLWVGLRDSTVKKALVLHLTGVQTPKPIWFPESLQKASLSKYTARSKAWAPLIVPAPSKTCSFC